VRITPGAFATCGSPALIGRAFAYRRDTVQCAACATVAEM
jgi:hypothetical protein